MLNQLFDTLLHFLFINVRVMYTTLSSRRDTLILELKFRNKVFFNYLLDKRIQNEKKEGFLLYHTHRIMCYQSFPNFK